MFKILMWKTKRIIPIIPKNLKKKKRKKKLKNVIFDGHPPTQNKFLFYWTFPKGKASKSVSTKKNKEVKI